MEFGEFMQRIPGYLLILFDVLQTTVVFLFLFLYGAIRACLPASILGRKSVRNQIVLITGAGSGLGRLMARRFAILGSKLILVDVNTQGNEETAKMIKSMGVDVHTFTCDLSNKEDIYRMADEVKHKVGHVDILINNAGIVTGKKLNEAPDALMEKTMDVNTNAHFWTLKAFLPHMMETGQGHVVSIASCAGLFGAAGLVDYCASKFGAVGAAESIALELYIQGKTGIKTTMICPFFISTGMFDGVSSNLIPILTPEYAVDKIMDAVLTDQPVLLMPRIMYLFYAMKGILPIDAVTYLGEKLGMLNYMETFKGRH